MVAIAQPSSILIHRPSSGGLYSFSAAADTDEYRGNAFTEAFADLIAGDNIYFGPGTYEIDEGLDLPDGVKVHCYDAIWTHRSGENGIRMLPGNGSRFYGVRSTSTGPTFSWADTDAEAIDNVEFHHIDVSCSEDSFYLGGPDDGATTRTWTFKSCTFRTSAGAGHNDTFVHYTQYLHLKFFGCEFINLASGSVVLDSSCFEAGLPGAGAGAIADFYGGRFLSSPGANPAIASAVIQTYGAATVRLFGCQCETVGGFANQKSLEANHTSRIEVSGSQWDTSIDAENDTGNIVDVTSTAP